MNKKFMYKKFFAILMCTVFLSACNASFLPGTDSVQPDAGTGPGTDNESIANNGNTGNEGDSTAASIGAVSYEDNDYYSDWKGLNPGYIELKGTDAVSDAPGVSIKKNIITITAAGVYVISGSLDEGQIIIDVKNKGIVRLVLNGAEIHCSDNAPIYVKNAEKTIISLHEGTHNTISDGENYVFPDSSTDEPNAAIFSKDNLTINGTGTLTVCANYNNGITSKDDLKIMGGNINIYSADDALMGRDLVTVKEADITIEAGGDGIKATNDEDNSKGLVFFEGGIFGIEAGAKGVKACSGISITGGTFTVNSTDDAVHSNDSITIQSGDFTIASDDDGIHADSSITIAGGKINITKSYEGIESALISISGGDIHIISRDDGINIAGGNDGSSINGRPGQNMFRSTGNDKLNMSGGYVVVDATGDGLDANGSVYISGGTLVISGPISNNNGALDYDGVFEITGGLLIAAGSAGMAQAPSEQSTQYSVIMNFTGIQQAGSLICLKDSDGNEIAAFSPERQYQSVVFSSPELKKDNTYVLYIDGEEITDFTVSDIVTWLSENGVTSPGGFNPGGFNHGGHRNPGSFNPDNRNNPDGFNPGDRSNPSFDSGGQLPPQN